MQEVGRLDYVRLDIAMVVVGVLNDDKCDDDRTLLIILR